MDHGRSSRGIETPLRSDGIRPHLAEMSLGRNRRIGAHCPGARTFCRPRLTERLDSSAVEDDGQSDGGRLLEPRVFQSSDVAIPLSVAGLALQA